ncbi:glycoside hydrolase family 3 protein [Saccharopolyspora griseoalba]|uniref:Glycoside hydrolase family 3 C-terminal domain-containing protein n=1 Tax=Saccharopolyspora griseoalba TaxID=1431848 RepID=A0ABW2LSJ8_9PSEU
MTNYDELITALSPPEKVELLTGASMFALRGEQRIDLAPMAFSDGPTGVRGLEFTGGEVVALFPNATLLASAWSTSTAHEVGEMLADEAERQRIHVVLGPTINLHRTPLGGRLFEQYAEDPLLTGHLAAAYVRGLQSRGIGACLKHLVANESETERNYVSSEVSEATLRELYLLPFEIAVEDARPWSIMAAYNDVNGVAATEHEHVNNEVVKGEWGWDGLLMSDWFATKTAAAAANGGLDLVMPGPDGPWGASLVAAVEAGEVDEKVVDDHLRRLLRLADRVGALGRSRAWRGELPAPDSPQRRAELRRLATDGMVVLRNDDALPLPDAQRVALIGRHALETTCMGGGSATVRPPHQVSIAEGLRSALGDRVEVVDGVEVRSLPAPSDALEHPETGEPGVRMSAVDADGEVLGDRHREIASATVEGDSFDRPVARVVFAGRSAAGGRMNVGAIGTGAWRLRVDGEEVAAFTLTADGHDPGEATLIPPRRTVEVSVPAGGLVEAELRIVATEPVPGPDGVVGVLSNAIASGLGFKALVASPVPVPAEDTLATAVTAAREADVAVVAVGLTEEQETESRDKSTLRLPGEQDALVRAVASAASRTVVVVNAATPVLMPWAEEVDAIVVAGLPGQEGGHAVADALLGVREPAGRLVTTWPAADAAAPAWDVVPRDLRLEYAEGTFIGHRGHHAGLAAPPAYWFGQGEGYGSWSYEAARLVEGAPSPSVEVRVRNTAPRDSREIVQVYLQPTEPDQPVRLVGWAPVAVAAGESASVVVPTDPRSWRRWSGAGWAPLSGGELLVARGLGDVRHRLVVPDRPSS